MAFHSPVTVNNPVVPFAIPVEGGISEGKIIIINGRISYHADRFVINLQSTPSLDDYPKPDMALHMSVRFDQACVVRNTCQYDSWSSEERHGGMPFYRGSAFSVTINIEHNRYAVLVNGKEFVNFSYRMPKEVGSFLRMYGDVEVDSVMFHSKVSLSYPAPSYPSSVSLPLYNPKVPLNYAVGPLSPGRMIFISGIPSMNAERFNVNLQCGLLSDADIAFHFDARINYSSDRRVCVRNHRERDGWGSEERSATYFPFQVQSPFEMIILVESNCFKVAVNNKHFLEFAHRIGPLYRIDSLNIEGDVRLTLVRVQ